MTIKTAVLGASGRTGLAVVRALLARNIHVIAVVRNASRLPADLKAQVTVVEGEGTDPTTAKATLKHSPDVVVCAVGAPSPRGVQTVRTDVTRTFVDAIANKDTVRFLAVSSVGAHDSASQVGFITRLVLATILKHVMADHTSQEDAITTALPNHRWLVVRPTTLNDKPVENDYQLMETQRLRSANISRNTVAEFIAAQVSGTDTGADKTPAHHSFWGKKIAISL